MECEEDHRLLEAAKALLILSTTLPPDRPPASTNHPFRPHQLPPVVTNIENVFSVFLPPWGLRQTRSSRKIKLKRKRMEGPPCLAAADASRVHRSPDTPLEVGRGTDPSTSGSDGLPCSSEIPPCKRFRACETTAAQGFGSHIKVSSVERPTMVEENRPSHPMKRQGRKKTKSELQAEERFLLEDNERLTKILEFEMIEREAMIAENRRLLSELASSQRSPADAQPEKLNFLLPDLNAPVLECPERGCSL